MPGRIGPGRLEARKRRLERHAEVEDPDVVLNAASRFLELRSRSVDEVRRHLASARYPDDLVERAIARLLELGMLDDRAFGRAWVESRDRARPRGEQALRRELVLKGLDRELVAEVLAERAGEGVVGASGEEMDESRLVEPGADRRAAEKLLARRATALGRVADPRQRRQRAYALLARNGFGPEVCREVSIRFVAEGTADADAADLDPADPNAPGEP